MTVCVDKNVANKKCSLRMHKSSDGKYRCSEHYSIFNYGFCKERHLTKVKATGKDSLCGKHRSGKPMKKVLAVGDTNSYGITIVDGPVNDGNKYVWKVICPVCQKEYSLSTADFHKRKSCQDCKGIISRKSSEEITWKNHYGMVKSRKAAKEKGFNLSLQQFIEISKRNCYYCGASPTPTNGHRSWSKQINTNGLDRVDPSMGYLLSNVVPCCKDCNIAKLDKTEKDFILWLKRVAKHQGIIM